MKTCKGLFLLQIYLFVAERRPDGIRKSEKMRPKKGNARPAWTHPNQKIFFGKKYNFSCTSIHLSKLSDQPAPQDQVGVDVLKPCVQYILLKCGNAQMSAPAAHCKKQATALYLDTNPGSTVLQPRGFSHGRKSEMMWEGALSILVPHWEGQTQNVHMILAWYIARTCLEDKWLCFHETAPESIKHTQKNEWFAEGETMGSGASRFSHHVIVRII